MSFLGRQLRRVVRRSRPTVSICCMTKDPPAQVARTLKLLKPVADEIVVAVDSRVDVTSLAPLASISDTLLRFEYRPPVDRPRAWLASHCKSDWLFWIDGDEVPSQALIAAIPRLIEARDILQFQFTRRWLFPDLDHWIDEHPWWPDIQIRLIRNDPATQYFGLTHEPLGQAWPTRVVDAPLYHLAALDPQHVRLEKIERYELERPGMVSPAGGPFNEVLLTPEKYVRRSQVAVPPDDRATIAGVLLDGSSPTPYKLALGIASSGAVDAPSPARVPSDADYRASIVVMESDLRFALGVSRTILVQLTNEGGMIWSGGERRPPFIRASYHWLRSDGSVLVHAGHRTLLPSAVAPGQSILIPIYVEPPDAEGLYILELDLLNEGVRWFNCSARVEVDVVANRHRPRRALERPRISVAICTRDRPDRLRLAIDSVLRQNHPPDEVELLIVDNAADPARLKSLAAEYRDQASIRWCHEPAAGLSRSRNLAVRVAKSELIAFMDDDAVANPDWVQNIVAAFDQFGPQTHALGGCVEPIWEAPRPGWLHDDLLGYFSVVDWGGPARHVGPENWVAGTNMAFRTEALRAIEFSQRSGRRFPTS